MCRGRVCFRLLATPASHTESKAVRWREGGGGTLEVAGFGMHVDARVLRVCVRACVRACVRLRFGSAEHRAVRGTLDAGLCMHSNEQWPLLADPCGRVDGAQSTVGSRCDRCCRSGRTETTMAIASPAFVCALRAMARVVGGADMPIAHRFGDMRNDAHKSQDRGAVRAAKSGCGAKGSQVV